jgi:hypothetical protein
VSGAAVERGKPQTPAAGISQVVARLREIEASAAPHDGVACFARLYREVTEAVAAELRGRGPDGAVFVGRLDVRFADCFFSGLDAWEHAPASAPRAWAPLFEARRRPGIAPLQFALAGMNAHINRDLPVALAATCGDLGLDLDDDSAQHRAYEHVNVLLAHVEERLKPSYLTGVLGALDRLVHRCHRLDDVVAMWDVARARDAAWANGRALWALRDEPKLASDFLVALDRSVGLAGRGLLIPADTFLGRLARL